ncbi:urea ABC transporter ATP-binding protein UrtD [Myxococcota bacterium]|nr:urea ABC transporter ATP-binding protein UrtD [Myxococcota bacterium]
MSAGARVLDSSRVDTHQGGILYVEGVSVAFDGFKALDDLNLYLDEGELRCIIGPNGAGKTTLMDVITGKTRPDTGTIFFGSNVDLTTLEEHEIVNAGIGRKFQTPTVFEQHSVLENLEVAAKANKRVWSSLFGTTSAVVRDKILEVAETVGLAQTLDRQAGNLSHGQKQWLEIGMLLAQDPMLLLVDEPVAGMSQHEVERTGELLSGLAGSHTVVVVEHDMEFIRSIARKVTVLHQGRVIAEGEMDDVQQNPDVVEVYLGE